MSCNLLIPTADSEATFAAVITLPIPHAECRIDSRLPELQAVPVPGSEVIFVSDRVIEVRFKGIATYRIEDGRKVVIRPEPGVDDETVLYYLKATPFGLLVLQRGELPLHTSAVVPQGGGGAVLMAGVPGAGKSTTAALLIRRGWSILNDDISRVTFEDGVPTAWPGFQSLKLGDGVLPMLQLEEAGLPATPGVKKKRYWHLEGCREPSAVAAMFFLENPRGGFLPPRRVAGMEQLGHLYRHTMRQFLVKPLGFHAAHFEAITHFAREVPCYRIEGNQSCDPEQLVEHIERCAAMGEGAFS